MDISTIIISPISGAIIGYFTNWLAIKMLFRPHERKKLFGINLPFTPGLIPKERARLAASIGRTIENHLLTEDALVKRFTSPEVIDMIGGILDGWLNKLKADDRTLKQVFDDIAGENAGTYWDNLEKYSVGAVKYVTANEDLHKILADFLANKISEAIRGFEIKSLAGLAGTLKESLYDRYLGFVKDGGLDNFVEANGKLLYGRITSEPKTLREILPDRAVITIKQFAGELLLNAIKLFNGLSDINPELDDKLRELTRNVIDESVSGILNIFINKDKVYENIKTGLYAYVSEPDNQAAAIMKIWGLLDKLLDKPAGELFGKISESTADGLIGKLAGFLKYDVPGGLYEQIWKGIDSAINNADFDMHEALSRAWPQYTEKLSALIENGLRTLSGDGPQRTVEALASNGLNKIFSVKLSALYDKLGEGNIGAIKSAVLKLITLVIKSGASHIAGSLDLGKIAEEQMNGMDVVQAEDIIVSVCNRELRTITVLGGVLGFVIGLLPIVLQLTGR